MIFFFRTFLICLVFYSSSIFAKDTDSRLSFGAGIYNFMENGWKTCIKTADKACDGFLNYKYRSYGFNLEYFSSKRVFEYIKPLFGFLGTSRESYYSYFGLSGDLYFAKCKCFIITPSLAVGYHTNGSDVKLGHGVQFRSGGDITYRFKNNVRVGLGIFHMSNANLGESNPGSEQIIFKYQIPLDR